MRDVSRVGATHDWTTKDATPFMTTTPRSASHVARSGHVAGKPVSELVARAAAQLLIPRVWLRTRFLVDLTMLSLGACAAVLLAPELASAPDRLLAALFPIVAAVSMNVQRGSRERMHGSILDTAGDVVGGVSSAAVLTMAAASAIDASHPVGLTLRLWLFAVVYAGLARMMLTSLRNLSLSDGALAIPTLIIGAGSIGELLVKRLSHDPRYGLRPVGFLDADPMPKTDASPSTSVVPVLGGPNDLAAAVAQTGARRVILAFSSEPDRALVDKVAECQRLGVEVALVPRLFESINQRATLDHVGASH